MHQRRSDAASGRRPGSLAGQRPPPDADGRAGVRPPRVRGEHRSVGPAGLRRPHVLLSRRPPRAVALARSGRTRPRHPGSVGIGRDVRAGRGGPGGLLANLLASLDLAFTGGAPSCQADVGRRYVDLVDGRRQSPRGSLPRLHDRAAGRPGARDRRGRDTAAHLVTFRDWIRDYAAAHPQVRFVNVTGAGPAASRHGGRIEAGTPTISPLPCRPRTPRSIADTVRSVRAGAARQADKADVLARLSGASPLALLEGHAEPSAAAARLVVADLTNRIVSSATDAAAAAARRPRSPLRRRRPMPASRSGCRRRTRVARHRSESPGRVRSRGTAGSRARARASGRCARSGANATAAGSGRDAGGTIPGCTRRCLVRRAGGGPGPVAIRRTTARRERDRRAARRAQERRLADRARSAALRLLHDARRPPRRGHRDGTGSGRVFASSRTGRPGLAYLAMGSRGGGGARCRRRDRPFRELRARLVPAAPPDPARQWRPAGVARRGGSVRKGERRHGGPLPPRSRRDAGGDRPAHARSCDARPAAGRAGGAERLPSVRATRALEAGGLVSHAGAALVGDAGAPGPHRWRPARLPPRHAPERHAGTPDHLRRVRQLHRRRARAPRSRRGLAATDRRRDRLRPERPGGLELGWRKSSAVPPGARRASAGLGAPRGADAGPRRRRGLGRRRHAGRPLAMARGERSGTRRVGP